MSEPTPIPIERIERSIRLVRLQKVMLDADLAALYGVETRALVQAVKRNPRRFPEDFLFQLTAEEVAALRSQIVISKGRGGRRHLPYAFTEQGVAMLSSVLKSSRAAEVNVEIMRTFIRLRHYLAGHRELARRLESFEKKTDARFLAVFDAINKLVKATAKPAPPPRPRAGFLPAASKKP